MTKLDSILKSRDITLPTKVRLVKAMVFPSHSHVWMWDLDYKESWALKNWCFWIVVLEKTLESPLDFREVQPIHSKGNQSWIFIGRTDVEAETPVLWASLAKNWLIGKDSDSGKDWGQEEKGTTEDKVVEWHHWLDGHELEQALGVSDGQWSLVYCSPWGCKVLDMTEWLNWTYQCKLCFFFFLLLSKNMHFLTLSTEKALEQWWPKSKKHSTIHNMVASYRFPLKGTR